MSKLYHDEIASAVLALLTWIKTVRARLARYVALAVLRVPAPGWLENWVTATADVWLSKEGL